VGGVGAEGTQLMDEAQRRERLQAARELGERLVGGIEPSSSSPDQDTQFAAFADHIRQLVTPRKDQWPYDRGYWRERGWLGE
jgi:hypothetical protein